MRNWSSCWCSRCSKSFSDRSSSKRVILETGGGKLTLTSKSFDGVNTAWNGSLGPCLRMITVPIQTDVPSLCNLFLFRPTCGNKRAVRTRPARPTSVRVSLRLCLFIPSPPSISLTIHPSATVVCCHHRACIPPFVCLSTCRTPAGSYLSTCVSAHLYVFTYVCVFVCVGVLVLILLMEIMTEYN